MRFRLPRRALSAALLFQALQALFGPPAAAALRSIPEDVSIQAFARPSGDKLVLLVRVPMAALGDIQFPLRESGYLDFPTANTALPGAARYRVADSIDVYEDGALLAKPRVVSTRVAVLSESSFHTFGDALAHLEGPPLDPSVNTLPGQSWLDVLFEYPIRGEGANFSIQTRFAHLGVRVTTRLGFLADGAERTFTYEGDTGPVIMKPRRTEDASQFLNWGFRGLLNGTDYLLCVFCLLLPFRRPRDIVSVAAAFASAVPITLISSACGLAPDGLWFGPLIDTLVAVTILYLALANIAGGISVYRRTIEALIFGLIYGFSFSFPLAAKEQFAGAYPLWSAIFFNAGLEGALLLVVAVLIPVLGLLFRYSSVRYSSAKRIESIVLSVLAAHAAWHWMTERWERLSRFSLRWPVMDAAFLAAAMRWMMILVIFCGAFWFVSGFLRSSRSVLRSRNEQSHEI